MPAAAKWVPGVELRVPLAETTRAAVGLVVLVLLTASCATGEAPPDTTSGAEVASAATATPATASPPETRSRETTVPTTEPTTTDPAAVTTVPLPGEPSDFGPAEGASLAVVGVDHDDVLDVRDVPAGEIIATLGLLNPYVGLLEVRGAPSGEVLARGTRGRTPSWPRAGPGHCPTPRGTS